MFVAMYAQAVFLVGAFVDVGVGLPLADYGLTYTGPFGGSPGSVVSVLAYAAVLAWGVHDASLGLRSARIVAAALAGIGGAFGVSFLAIPWPRVAEFVVHGWSLHLALALYFSLLASAFLALAVRRANPAAFRVVWRHLDPSATVAFALLPLIGAVTADQLISPLIANAPPERYLVELPNVLAGMMAGAALFVQWRLVRANAWGPIAVEAARVAKFVALSFALPLGLASFLAAAIAGSLAWLGRNRRSRFLVGVIGAFAVLLGNLAVVAVDFVDGAIGPATFRLPVNRNPILTLEGFLVAIVAGVLIGLVSQLTSRTSASAKDRASS
jgi:hypothetical protein